MKRRIYTDDHEAFRASAREFVDREVRPRMEEFVEARIDLIAVRGGLFGRHNFGLVNDGFRERWDSNFLWVDARGGADASDLTREADRVLGGAGLTHREIRPA